MVGKPLLPSPGLLNITRRGRGSVDLFILDSLKLCVKIICLAFLILGRPRFSRASCFRIGSSRVYLRAGSRGIARLLRVSFGNLRVQFDQPLLS